ncbi:MAG: RNA pyrophosphohydrolase, partial [Brevundimonas aurantiaca]
MTDLTLYRPNVGVVLFNGAGQVWYGRRHATPGPHNWQFPQGGVDDGEDLTVAALRELKEETGVTSVEFLARTDDWILYDFPPEAMNNPKAWRGFKGQRQQWFAFRFTGKDSEIDLQADEE